MSLSRQLNKINDKQYYDSEGFFALHGIRLTIKNARRPIYTRFNRHEHCIRRLGIFHISFLEMYFPKNNIGEIHNISPYKNINLQSFRRILRYGNQCKFCGRKGEWICLEQDHGVIKNGENHWACQAYSDPNNFNTRMTIDHIHPISKGGKNSVKNYQILCYSCNQYKANSLEEGLFENYYPFSLV